MSNKFSKYSSNNVNNESGGLDAFSSTPQTGGDKFSKYSSAGSNVSSKFNEPEPEKESYLKRLGSSLMSQREEAQAEDAKAKASSKQAFQEGDYIKGIGNQLRRGIRAGSNVLNVMMSPISESGLVQKTVGGAIDIAKKIPGTRELIEGIPSAVAGVEKTFGKEGAKDIGDIVNMGSMFLGGKAATVGANSVKKPVSRALFKGGQAIKESGEASLSANRKKLVEDLVTVDAPKIGARVEDAVKRTDVKKGLFGKSAVTELKANAKAAANELSKIPEIKPGMLFQDYLNIVTDNITKRAGELVSHISKNNFEVVNPGRLISKFDDLLEKSIKNKGLVEAKSHLVNIAEKAKELWLNSEKTRLGAHNTRVALDKYIKDTVPKFFDDKVLEKSVDSMVKDIRKSFNNIVDDYGSDTLAKNLRGIQSNLYKAQEIIAVKAANQAKTPAARFWQKVNRVVKKRNTAIQALSGASAQGGLGAAALFAPFITIGIIIQGVATGAIRLATNPQLRIKLGEAFQKASGLLSKTEKDSMVRDLKEMGLSDEEIFGVGVRSTNPQPPTPKRINDFMNEPYTPTDKLPTINVDEIPRPRSQSGLPSVDYGDTNLEGNIYQGLDRVKQKNKLMDFMNNEPYIPTDKLPTIDAGRIPRPKPKDNNLPIIHW